jgi:streptogramin lyase
MSHTRFSRAPGVLAAFALASFLLIQSQIVTQARPAAAPISQSKQAEWTQFPSGTQNAPQAIVLGPRGDGIWAADSGDNALLSIPLTGSPVAKWPLTVLAYGKPEPFSPQRMTVGADGRFYVDGCTADGKYCNFILAVTNSGRITQYTVRSGDAPDGDLALGPDGNVWFTERQHLANIAPSGKIAEFLYHDGAGPSGPWNNSVVSGPDGNIWFTRNAPFFYGSVGRFDIAQHKVKYYNNDGCDQRWALTVVPGSSKMYFVCFSTASASTYYSIDWITTTGQTGGTPYVGFNAPFPRMAATPTGLLWQAGCENDNFSKGLNLTRYDTTNNVLSCIQSTLQPGQFAPIVYGPGHNLWMVTSSYFVRYGPVP